MAKTYSYIACVTKIVVAPWLITTIIDGWIQDASKPLANLWQTFAFPCTSLTVVHFSYIHGAPRVQTCRNHHVCLPIVSLAAGRSLLITHFLLNLFAPALSLMHTKSLVTSATTLQAPWPWHAHCAASSIWRHSLYNFPLPWAMELLVRILLGMCMDAADGCCRSVLCDHH